MPTLPAAGTALKTPPRPLKSRLTTGAVFPGSVLVKALCSRGQNSAPWPADRKTKAKNQPPPDTVSKVVAVRLRVRSSHKKSAEEYRSERSE
jgi:hypothetical protein